MRSIPQATGPTENVLRALLERQLEGTGIKGYLAWVAMNYSQSAEDRPRLEAMIERDTRRPADAIKSAIDELVHARLLDDDAKPSTTGLEALTIGRRRVQETTTQLMDEVEPSEVTVTLRVLDAVRERAALLLDGLAR